MKDHPEMVVDVQGKKWVVAMATFYRLVGKDDNTIAYLPTSAEHTSAQHRVRGEPPATVWKLRNPSVQDIATYEECERAKPGLCIRAIARIKNQSKEEKRKRKAREK
jgi:hypothetical protein